MDDNASDGNTSTRILVEVDNLSSSDTNFHGINQSLMVTNFDNDTVGSYNTNNTLSAGDKHNCTTLDNGSVMCWGSNSDGQIGDGTTTDRLIPVIVAGLTNVKSISAGQKHTCTALDNGSAKCWGSNSNGRLGDGTTAERLIPVIVAGLTNVKSISCGQKHTCTALDNGSAVCWGSNSNGQLGNGSTTNSATASNVLNLNNIRLQ